MAWWIPVLQAAGAVASTLLGNSGVDKATDAQTQANREAIDLQRGIYTDQVQRSEPWRKSGVNALNFQNKWLGLPEQGDPSGGPGTVAGAGNYDWNAYLEANPDVKNDWMTNAKLRGLYPNATDFAQYHYQNFGEREGRQLQQTGGGTYSPQPTGGATPEAPAGASGSPDLWETIKKNPLYVAATQGFLGIDKPQVEGAFSQGGQAISGAASKALFDRGTSRSYNALGDIYNQYAGVSGTGMTTASEQNSNAGAYGSNVGNALMDNGQIAGKAAAVKNANWQTGIGNALGAGYEYGKSKGWIK